VVDVPPEVVPVVAGVRVVSRVPRKKDRKLLRSDVVRVVKTLVVGVAVETERVPAVTAVLRMAVAADDPVVKTVAVAGACTV